MRDLRQTVALHGDPAAVTGMPPQVTLVTRWRVSSGCHSKHGRDVSRRMTSASLQNNEGLKENSSKRREVKMHDIPRLFSAGGCIVLPSQPPHLGVSRRS